MRIRFTMLVALLSLAAAATAPLAQAQEVGPPECAFKAFAPTIVKKGIVGQGRARRCTATVTVRLRVCLEEREQGESYRTLTCASRKRRLDPDEPIFLRTRARSCKSLARYRSVVRGRVGSSDPVTRRSRGRQFCAVGGPPPPPG